MSRKIPLSIAAVVLMLCAGLYAQDKPAGKKSSKPAAKGTPARPLRTGEKAILKALEEPASFELFDTPLSEFVAYLREKYRIAAHIDKKALADLNIASDTKLTFSVSDIPLRSALDLMLRDFDLAWMIRNDALLITTPEVTENSLVTKTYDVSDLAVPMGDYRYRGELLPTATAERSPFSILQGTGLATTVHYMSMPPGAKTPPAETAPGVPPMEGGDLVDVITNMVQPSTWDSAGGPGSIKVFAQLLVIAQTQAVHREIETLLADIRAKRRAMPTVVVDLKWLWLDQRQYEQLAGGKQAAPGRTDLALDAKALEQAAGMVGGFRGRIVCQSGQLAHAASGDRHSTITSAIPVVGSGIGYQPVVQVPNAGVVLELRPTVAPGGETALLDVQSVVTRWDQGGPPARVGASWPPAQVTEAAAKPGEPQESTQEPGGTATCMVDRPIMPAQQFASTVRVPLGKPVVLGAMTFSPTAGAGLANPPENPKQLYLIATTSVASFGPEAPAQGKKRKKG